MYKGVRINKKLCLNYIYFWFKGINIYNVDNYVTKFHWLKMQKATKDIIDNYGANYICPICYEKIKDKDNIHITKCKHFYHYIWIENKENNIYNDNNENYLVDILKNIINKEINNEIHLNEELITNYLKLLHLIISKLNSLNNKTLNEIDFSSVFTILINNFLIISPMSENKNELYSNNNSQDYIDYLFDLINIIIEINPQKYLLEFFSQEKIKNLISIYLCI